MSGLDINTPRGQATLAEEARAIELFKKMYPATTFVHTPKTKAAEVDGFMVRDGVIVGIAEFKCRKLTLDEFQRTFESNWLITFEKIVGGRRLADALCVPFWGLLYLVPSDVLLMKNIYDPLKGWQVTFAVRKTASQATCNGGLAVRDNAFVDMKRATVLKNGECNAAASNQV